MKNIYQLRINGSWSSLSSRDKILYTFDPELVKASGKCVEEFEKYGDGYTCHYLESDKTVYQFQSHRPDPFQEDKATDALLESTASKYVSSGWLTKEHEEVVKFKSYRNEIWAQREREENKIKKEKGYLNFWENGKSSPPPQGNIPDELWDHENLKSYRQSSICFGYVGSLDRTLDSDIGVVKHLRELEWTDAEIATWMTSTDGRHFLDNDYEGETSLNSWTFQNYERDGVK